MIPMAANLRAARGRSGLTMVELARQAGVTPETVQRIEAGRILKRPQARTIARLAEVLGCTTEALELNGAESAPTAPPLTGRTRPTSPAPADLKSAGAISSCPPSE